MPSRSSEDRILSRPMNIVRWIVFAWGSIAALAMAYYALQWAAQTHNPYRNEFGIGFGLAFIYGFPAWVSLPVVTYLGRRGLRRVQLVLLLLPLVLALAAIAGLGFMGGL